MIFWIASYPKSGNTWVRLVLINYLNPNQKNIFDNLNLINDYPRMKYFDFLDKENLELIKKQNENIFKNFTISQEKLNLNNKINLLKTHSYCGSINNFDFTNKDNTAGFVYLVRDPRSVVVSLSYHSDCSFEKTVDDMIFEKHTRKNDDETLSFWSSWRINYLSWRNKDFPKLIIKYEDLVSNSFNEFKKILEFFTKFQNFNFDDKLLIKTLEKCSFNNMKENENNFGFKERIGKEKFFRKGENDEWKKVLSPKLINKIESNFKDEMKELNYL